MTADWKVLSETSMALMVATSRERLILRSRQVPLRPCLVVIGLFDGSVAAATKAYPRAIL